MFVCLFSNSDQFSWHQIGDLKFNSVLTFLPGISVRSHKLSTQSHKTASASPTPSDANRKPRLSPVFLSDWMYIGGSHTPLWFNNLLEWLTELRTTVYLPVYYRNNWIEEMHRTRNGEGVQIFHALFKSTILPASLCSLGKSSLNPFVRIFYRVLIT